LADNAEFRAKLLGLKAELESIAETSDEAAGVVELDQSRVGRLSRMDAMQAQSMSKESERRRLQQLNDIAAALVRIENGNYGNCLECEEPINPKRLNFDPAVRHCLDCASEINSV